MQIALRSDNTEEFRVFLNDVQFDCDEESGYHEPMANCVLTVEANDLAGYDTVDMEDIFLVCLDRLSDQTGFCILDCEIDRMVYIDKKFNTRITLTEEKPSLFRSLGLR